MAQALAIVAAVVLVIAAVVVAARLAVRALGARSSARSQLAAMVATPEDAPAEPETIGEPVADATLPPEPVPVPELEPEAASAPEPAPRPSDPFENGLVAPVELWMGDLRVGVKEGTPTQRLFRGYADSLFAALKEAKRGTR